jgi:hypothetical protein
MNNPKQTTQNNQTVNTSPDLQPATTTSESHHVTTTFVNDKSVASSDYTGVSHSADLPVEYQSIIDFMAKPFLIDTLTWTGAQTPETNLAQYVAESYIMSNTSWNNKVEGFSLCRGTAVLTVQLNSNPFQQGRLLISFLPQGGDLTGSQSYFKLHTNNLVQQSQLPNVELDCRDSVAVLKMPYIAPTNFYSLAPTAVNFGWGTFIITVLGQLYTSTEVNVNVSVYLHFEDFELAAPLIPQASSGRKKYVAGTFKKGTDESKLLSAHKPGTISQGLSLVSRVSAAIGSIPSLAPYAIPIAWFTRFGAGLASSFGWSKPLSLDAPTVVARQVNRYAANSDGLDTALPLGLICDNAVNIISDISIRTEDEMSMPFLLGVGSYVNQYSWSDTAAANSTIFNMPIGPSQAFQTYSINSHDTDFGPPMFYLSKGFKYWRGSIRIILKLVKTDYHTGRLEITFSPTDQAALIINPTITTSQLALREIIDIADGDQICLDLPYLLNVDFLEMKNQPTFGFLQVKVLNELRHPDTVANNVAILYYTCGGRDLQFAGPSPYPGHGSPWLPQGGSSELVCETIGGSADLGFRANVNQRTVGEIVTSVKQMLNRYCPFLIDNVAYATGLSNGCQFFPWALMIYGLGSGGLPYIAPVIGGDTFSYIAPMFAYYRGSVKVAFNSGNTLPITVFTLPTTNPPASQRNVLLSAFTGYFDASFSTAALNDSTYMGINIESSNVGAAFVKVPYYCKTRCSMVAPSQNMLSNRGSALISSDLSQPDSRANFVCNGTSTFSLARSFGDDFQLSYFLSCPGVLH